MNYMKKNLLVNIVFLILGAGFLIFSFLEKGKNSIVFGLGCSLLAVGLLNIVQSIILMRNPKKCDEIELLKNEERTVFLREKNNSTVYSIFIYIESIVIIIAAFLGYREVVIVVSLLLIAKLVVWMVIGTINGNRY
ncbi:hypothetical protein SAMN02745163_00738 [Clostridium cavendishii DSM 21758]|uniref:Uncharacterized protein n=1 Tax=Clostridium cavendishii DSM 21758 TaxID=1121302 RepID=A0A1M6DI14_9CLOT|nr:hypothetical protein [Clostridium cavendishii]SHI72954.1 hypothetical protein SAMN02745163_00738 [Clostridium cavendishii DSM 21758]